MCVKWAPQHRKDQKDNTRHCSDSAPPDVGTLILSLSLSLFISDTRLVFGSVLFLHLGRPHSNPHSSNTHTPLPPSVMDVPTATSLNEIYPEDAIKSHTERWNRLISKFKSEYGRLPDFVSRSPGRVNIIGEVCRASRVPSQTGT